MVIKALLLMFRWEPRSSRVQREVCLQPEGGCAHAAAERGGGKRLVPCQQQVRRQPHTSARLWNHPAGASPHWPGGVLWSAGEQLRALCHPPAIRGGGVRAGLSQSSHSFCLMCRQNWILTWLILNNPTGNDHRHKCDITGEVFFCLILWWTCQFKQIFP